MYTPSSGKGIALLVTALLLLGIFAITSGLAPVLIAAVVVIPTVYGLYVAGYRADRWLKGKRIRRGGDR